MGAFDDLIPGGKGGKLTNPDKTKLNSLSEQAASGYETQQEYQAAQAALKRFRPGPVRGAFMDAVIPEQGGGIMDAIAAATIGTPARALGVVTPQNITDFQRLKGLQSQRVLQEQLAQKGPQTDSDAARLQLTEISPYKMPDVNAQVVQSGSAKAQRAQQRAKFYTQWSNKYGLNAPNEQGQGVEDAFQAGIKSTAPPPAGLAPGWKVNR